MMELLERLSFRKNTREKGNRRDAAKESTHHIVPERNVKQKKLREGLEYQSENDENLDKGILEGGRIKRKKCKKVATEMERVQDDSVHLSHFCRLYLASLKDELPISDYRRMQRMMMVKQHGIASRKQIDISPDFNTCGQGSKKEENIEPMFPETGRVRKFMDSLFHFLAGEHKTVEYIEPVFPDSGRVRKFMDLLDSLLLEKNTERRESANGAKRSVTNSMFLRNDQGKELCESGNGKAGDVEELTEEEVDDRKECAEVSSEMNRYILVSEEEEDDDEWLSFLYKIYLTPLEDELPTSNEHRVPRITVIPHNFLCSFPFCAFIDPDGRYLVERYVITSIPSLRALCLLQERLSQLRKLQGIRKLKVLAVGNPKMTYPDIPELPFAGREAENVRDVFGAEECQLAVKEKATKELVLNEIKNVDILHLATHACPEDPEEENAAQQGDYIMRGFLMLASSGEDCDGFLNAHEIANATCNCQLVLLSCCETGLGKVTGDGVVGLYRAFLVAGAAGVLVTLWKISDYSTLIFMEKFYSVFKETEDVPLALRNTMLFCLKEKDFPPQEWAAFSLIGASKTRHKERIN